MSAGPGQRPARRVRGVDLALALLGVLHALSYLPHGPCDDEYIVYRYGRNLAEGLGWVFNPGERVEGFTVPLWTAVHALAATLHVPPVPVTRAAGLSAVAAAVLATAAAWRRLAPQARFPWPALLVALSPPLAFHAGQGLATAPLAALLALAFAALVRAEEEERPPTRAALLLGVAALVRQEAVLLALPVLLLVPSSPEAGTWNRGRARAALLALGPPAAWCVFRLAYFGRLVPSTFTVKRLPLADDLSYGLAYLGRGTLEAGVGVLLLLAPLALLRAPRGGRRALVAGVAGVSLHALYVVAVGGDYMDLARFFVPTLPLMLLLAALAVDRLLAKHPVLEGGLLAAAAILLQIGALRPALRPRGADGPWLETEHVEWAGRHAFQEERWIRLGRAFAAACPPGTRVGLSPIGAFGYFSRLPIVDLLGLTHEGFRNVPPDLSITMKGHHRYDADWVLAREPACLVLGNGALQPGTGSLVVSAWERTLVEHPRFAELYRPLVLPIPGDEPLVFFGRRDRAPPRGAVELP